MNITIDNYSDLYFIKEQKIDRLFSDTCSVNRFAVPEARIVFICLVKVVCQLIQMEYLLLIQKKDVTFNTK